MIGSREWWATGTALGGPIARGGTHKEERLIRSVRLHNFKSFTDAEVTFGNVSIVVGTNGAGKSNLFDALRFLKAIGDGRSVRDAIEGHATPLATLATTTIIQGVRGGAESIVHFNSKSKEFALTVKLLVDRDVIEYFVRIDAARYRVIQEELKSKKHPGSYVFSTQPETGPLEQDPELPVVVARFYKETRGLNPRREFSPHEFILSQFSSRRAESRLNEAIAEAAREELSSIRPLELRPEVLRQYSPVGRSELGEHGENFAAVVWQLNWEADRARIRQIRDADRESQVQWGHPAQDRLDAVVSWLSELTPRAISSIGAERSLTGEAIFTVTEEPFDRSIPAPSLSDGTLRFAALALAALGTEGRQTLVIEEIENGINPARLALLIRMLEQATEGSSAVQVITSTHSPSVLQYASKATINSSLVIGWDADGCRSRPVAIKDLPEIEQVLGSTTIADLQTEGWLQQAADV